MSQYCYKYPRPALAVDCVVLSFDGAGIKVLLIQRKGAPFRGGWALPGGFVNVDEDLEPAAHRELQEETGVDHLFLEQLYTFGTLGRDPRGRTISVAYYALVRLEEVKPKAGDDAAATDWFSVNNLPKLAFDHDVIVAMALERLRGKIRYQPLAFDLLAPEFTLSQLQLLHEMILEKQLDKRNFRKKALSLGLLKPVKGKQQAGAHRPAQLYMFDRKKYESLKKRGNEFEF